MTEENTQTTEPATQTTEPATQTTEPATQTTEPATQTTEPATQTTEPEKIEPIEFREVDKPYIEKITAMLKDNDVPAAKQAGLYKAFSALQDEISQDYQKKSAKELEDWKAEQGDDLAKNQELARRGSAALGLDEDQMNKVEMVLGTKAFMTLSVKLGTALSEDSAKGLGGSGVTENQEMSTEAFIQEIFNKAKG